jgi:hypothetical protein
MTEADRRTTFPRSRSLPRSALLRLPGLYRVRRTGREELDYISQTGMSLRKRLGMLRRGVLGEQMPYRDPHTAGPVLWALRELGGEFEVLRSSAPAYEGGVSS